MLIISIFYLGNFQQKVLIINILLRLRMSTSAHALMKTSLNMEMVHTKNQIPKTFQLRPYLIAANKHGWRLLVRIIFKVFVAESCS